MDRAALIMIADLADIAGIVYENSTGLHILVTACDKRVRPALIKKAGKKLLSSVYDNKDLPALFLFFGMSDLSIPDLDAIEKVFSKNDLRQVMSKRRQGKNALEIFTELSPKVRQNAPRERNEFNLNTAVKTTKLGAGSIVQEVSPVSQDSFSVPSVNVITGKRVEPANVSIPHTPTKKTQSKPVAHVIIPKTMKVMIVDDDEIIRNLLQLRLKLLGYEIFSMAESGEEAVSLSEKTKPDLVFMDIMMPGKLDGIQAARLIKANSNSRIIFLSGYSDNDILDRAKEVQPDGFIVKPFTDTVLRVTLNFLK